jgi:hypothetical protein
MPQDSDLSVLLRTARQLSRLCQQGAAMVEEARRAQAAAYEAAYAIPCQRQPPFDG